MRKTFRCPSVEIDGMHMDLMEEFADYLPEGITLKPEGTYDRKMSTRNGCLCAVDMEATARANGYLVKESNGRCFILIQDLQSKLVPLIVSREATGG